MITQEQVDDLVARCRKLVAQHGGQNPLLKDVRTYYAMFLRRAEAGAYVFLEAAITKAKQHSAQSPHEEGPSRCV